MLNQIYFLIPDQIYSDMIYHYGVVLQCASLINAFAPLEQVAAVQNHLMSVHADLQIIRGCDSAGVLFLMMSAVLAFRANWPKKLLGLVLGIALIYGLNIARVTGIYFLVAYHREWFEFVHVYLAPTLMTLFAFIFFAWWAIGCRDVAKPA
ncbi:exosortase family protein XrtM [Methylomonas sp. AM2-LC]|uniref:exosortase family protein XrtM n=1 Tax=Methylomonas sp. AM2-LC TaxID=3153301 RepID=UPI003265437C